MHKPPAHSPARATAAQSTSSAKRALAAALIASSLLFTAGGTTLNAQQAPGQKGPTSVICSYIPQLCGGWN